MARIKKNKIHNPQFVTEDVPDIITTDDIGRLWIDKTNKKFVVGMYDDQNNAALTDLMTTVDKEQIQQEISNSISEAQSSMADIYFSEVKDVYATVVRQVNGDTHFDQGYDFFTDDVFTGNSTQDIDDYYSFYYIEVFDVGSAGYLRTITTDQGNKHIRLATGADNYVHNSQSYKVVNYSKIVLPFTVKGVVEIKFENKDVMEQGFVLADDKQTILIYGDPEGYLIDKKVKVRYLI